MATTQQSGFAPAASPLASTIVQTPDDAIVAGFTSIPSQGDNMPAYHARPKQSDGPLPVVIVVQEIFGVHEHIRDICRRLALEGYLAIAPELYFREGDPNDFADIPTLLSGLVAKVPDSQVLADLDHVASWASRNGGDVHRLMITGFCWGGRITWLYATRRFSAYMAARITAFRKRAWKRCARRCGQQTRKQRLSCTRMQGMRSTPIIVRAIMPNLRKTAGSECWNGLHSMVLKSNAIVAKSDD